MSESLSHFSDWICSSHFPDLFYEKRLSSVLWKSRQCLWHPFWNKHAHTSSILYLGNQWHSSISSTTHRKGSCSSLSERDAASERSAEFTSIDPVQGADETLQLLGNLSSANRDSSPPGKKIPFWRKVFCLKVSVWLWSAKKKKKKSQRKYLSRSKIIIFFLNNNNVSHW